MFKKKKKTNKKETKRRERRIRSETHDTIHSCRCSVRGVLFSLNTCISRSHLFAGGVIKLAAMTMTLQTQHNRNYVYTKKMMYNKRISVELLFALHWRFDYVSHIIRFFFFFLRLLLLILSISPSLSFSRCGFEFRLLVVLFQFQLFVASRSLWLLCLHCHSVWEQRNQRRCRLSCWLASGEFVSRRRCLPKWRSFILALSTTTRAKRTRAVRRSVLCWCWMDTCASRIHSHPMCMCVGISVHMQLNFFIPLRMYTCALVCVCI